VNTILRTFPQALRERPLDFYTAAVLFVLGSYELLGASFSSKFNDQMIFIIVNIIGGYFIAASSLIMISMMCNKVKKPIFSIMGEFYGWMFVTSASIATVLLYLSSLVWGGAPENWLEWSAWMIAWIGMALAAFLRTVDLWQTFKVVR
jgi:hypothetical protein